jgi:hypothetical protein
MALIVATGGASIGNISVQAILGPDEGRKLKIVFCFMNQLLLTELGNAKLFICNSNFKHFAVGLPGQEMASGRA